MIAKVDLFFNHPLVTATLPTAITLAYRYSLGIDAQLRKMSETMKEIEASIAEIKVILKEADSTLGEIQREVGGGGVRSSGEDPGEDAWT